MATCRLLTTFENSLGPNQERQNVGPDLDQTVWHSDADLKEFFFKSAYDNKRMKIIKHANIPCEMV